MIFISPSKVLCKVFLGLSLLLFSARVQWRATRVVGFSSEQVPDPSTSPSHDNDFHALLMTLSKNLFAWDVVSPEYSFNSSQIILSKTDSLVRSLRVIL